MGSQREFDLPGLGQVTVIDTDSASKHLKTMTANFRQGKTLPMVFGDAPALDAEAVVIPFREWLRLLKIASDADADTELLETVRERIANSSPENAYSLEDLGIDLDADGRGNRHDE